MRNLWITGTVCVALAGCSQRESLTPEDGMRVLRKELKYPRPYVYDIFCADPEYARKVLDAGLENDGLLMVNLTRKIAEAGKPLIVFTPKASPYLMASSIQDTEAGIRKVKIADEELVQVMAVKTGDDGTTAAIEYTTAYRNITPFATLVRTDMKREIFRTARLALHNDGWHVDRKK